ncbi:MAG: hypothetical protein IPG69_12810 [Flavobacteriales bacterium]|nr:hypothetical protein [Flavobacteriales bacterium]
MKKFAYDIWGDTVNTASRMESSGEVGQVNISEATYALVKNVSVSLSVPAPATTDNRQLLHSTSPHAAKCRRRARGRWRCISLRTHEYHP